MSEEADVSGTAIRVQVLDSQRHLAPPEPLLAEAVRTVLADHGIAVAQVNLLLVDDEAIRELNRRFLNHDWATDCITFPLERSEHALEGEIAVSAETACRQAPQYGLTPEEELLLYVIHGALHLVGYEDGSETARAEMESRQRGYLERFRPRLNQAAAGEPLQARRDKS